MFQQLVLFLCSTLLLLLLFLLLLMYNADIIKIVADMADMLNVVREASRFS